MWAWLIAVFMVAVLIDLSECMDSALTDSCYKIYQDAISNQGNVTDLNLSAPIGSLRCKNSEFYHCLKDENNRQIELCIQWILLDPGLCPTFISYNSKIHVKKCDASLPGCPKEVYQSYQLYKYGECLNQLKKENPTKQPGTGGPGQKNGENGSSGGVVAATGGPGQKNGENGSSGGVVAAVVVVLLLLAITAAVIAVIVYRKRRREKLEYADRPEVAEEMIPKGIPTEDGAAESKMDGGEAMKMLKDKDEGASTGMGARTLLGKIVNEQGDDMIGDLVRNGDSTMAAFIKRSQETVYLPRFKAQMYATRCLMENNYVIVTGEQGSGRKLLAKEMLIKYMLESTYAPVIIRDTVYIPYLIESDRSYAVMFDTSELNPGEEEDKFYTETLPSLKDVKNVVMIVVIKIGDYTRLKDSGKIKQEMVIDLSARAYQMTKQDKKELFKMHCKARGVMICHNKEEEDLTSDPPKISLETINAIVSVDLGKGFPKACELFFSDKFAFARGVNHFQGMVK